MEVDSINMTKTIRTRCMVKIKEFVQISKQLDKPISPGSRGLKKNKEGSVRYFSAGMKKQTKK